MQHVFSFLCGARFFKYLPIQLHNGVCSYHHHPVRPILHSTRGLLSTCHMTYITSRKCQCTHHPHQEMVRLISVALPAVFWQPLLPSPGSSPVHTARVWGRGSCPESPQTGKGPPQMETPGSKQEGRLTTPLHYSLLDTT